jgi:hypothetical protein
MLSFLGYRIFNHPEICSGDQSRINLLAMIVRSFPWVARRHAEGATEVVGAEVLDPYLLR